MQSWIHVIEWRANTRPEVTALADDRGVTYTYAELLAEVELRAGGWAGLGVQPGDVVVPVLFPMPVDGDWGYDRTITAIEEYLDSAKRSSIRAAREALSGPAVRQE
jgi:hypothetical protein